MSELSKVVEQAKKSGTAEHTEAINDWGKKIKTGVLVLAGLLLVLWVWFYLLPAAPSDVVATKPAGDGFSFATLFLFFIATLIAGSVIPRWGWVAHIGSGIIVLLILSDFAPGLNTFWNRATRGINHGDWSAPADYVEKIYGGSLRVNPGQSKTVDISGKIRVPIPVHHCLDISPHNSFFITWDGPISNAYIEPKSGRMERVTVTALDAYQCQQPRL